MTARPGHDFPIGDYVARFPVSPFAASALLPWQLTAALDTLLPRLIETLGPAYRVREGVAMHGTAVVEPGAIIKPPAILGPGSFVAATAYLRGGVFLEEDCIVGPAAELKSALMFRGSKLAHLNFVGDSILGEGVNVEAGAMIANYRNERADKRIRFWHAGRLVDTGVDKFGALVGDGGRIGANAVVAPGAVIAPAAIVPRLALVDQAAGPAS